MRKTLLALAAAGSLAVLAVGAPSKAEAGGGCFGCAVGAGVLGGLFAGAIIGSAVAGPPQPIRAAAPVQPPVIIQTIHTVEQKPRDEAPHPLPPKVRRVRRDAATRGDWPAAMK